MFVIGTGNFYYLGASNANKGPFLGNTKMAITALGTTDEAEGWQSYYNQGGKVRAPSFSLIFFSLPRAPIKWWREMEEIGISLRLPHLPPPSACLPIPFSLSYLIPTSTFPPHLVAHVMRWQWLLNMTGEAVGECVREQYGNGGQINGTLTCTHWTKYQTNGTHTMWKQAVPSLLPLLLSLFLLFSFFLY